MFGAILEFFGLGDDENIDENDIDLYIMNDKDYYLTKPIQNLEGDCLDGGEIYNEPDYKID